jgi:hypothetical protein
MASQVSGINGYMVNPDMKNRRIRDAARLSTLRFVRNNGVLRYSGKMGVRFAYTRHLRTIYSKEPWKINPSHFSIMCRFDDKLIIRVPEFRTMQYFPGVVYAWHDREGQLVFTEFR